MAGKLPHIDPRTTGAWIIHHAGKLQDVRGATEFDNLEFAGKCGQFMAAIAEENTATLTEKQISAIAKAHAINSRSELPTIIEELKSQKVLDEDFGEYQVVGLTTGGILVNTANLFNGLEPSKYETAALDFAEQVSNRPVEADHAKEYVGDTYKLKSDDAQDFLSQVEKCGFVDKENLDPTNSLYFNGNLFRRDSIGKIQKIFGSLNSAETRKLNELCEALKAAGCMELTEVQKRLGIELFKKVNAIGFLDVNAVSNDHETVEYVTLPSSFNKFGNSLIEDAFDFAKILVASLTYGMTKSAGGRGRITMVGALLNKLIAGQWVGPASAIGEDYKILELRRVVQIRPESANRYSMKLLKPEVGRIAKQVLIQGGAVESSVLELPQASLTKFKGPEANRVKVRANQSTVSRRATAEILDSLRTGGEQ